MNLREILQHKGTDVFTTVPAATLEKVVHQLVEYNCGSLVVCHEDDDQHVVGIITERDILRTVAFGTVELDKIRVGDVMTSDVMTLNSESAIEETMGLMTEKRIRHLPIVDDDRLVGIISIGDVVKAQHDYLTAENHHLKNYIQG